MSIHGNESPGPQGAGLTARAIARASGLSEAFVLERLVDIPEISPNRYPFKPVVLALYPDDPELMDMDARAKYYTMEKARLAVTKAKRELGADTEDPVFNLFADLAKAPDV